MTLSDVIGVYSTTVTRRLRRLTTRGVSALGARRGSRNKWLRELVASLRGFFVRHKLKVTKGYPAPQRRWRKRALHRARTLAVCLTPCTLHFGPCTLSRWLTYSAHP